MNIRAILFLILVFLAGGLFFAFRVSKQGNQNPGKIQVATSFYPLYFFTTQVGGDKAQVFNITPASAEPHDYDPTTKDIAKVQDSRMIVLNGGKLESWGNKIRDNLKGSKTLVIVAGDSLATRELSENGKKIQDPHVWLDPTLAKQEIEKIKEGFIKVDPANKAYYEKKASDLEKKLDQIDSDFKKGLANCQQKDIVTSHAAFGYLAARYGLTQIPISGVSPDQEPSAQKLTEIADLVRKNNIKVIFFESLVSPKLSQTIASETGAKTMVLDPIEGVAPQDLKNGVDYIKLMNQNLENLQTALQCQ